MRHVDVIILMDNFHATLPATSTHTGRGASTSTSANCTTDWRRYGPQRSDPLLLLDLGSGSCGLACCRLRTVHSSSCVLVHSSSAVLPLPPPPPSHHPRAAALAARPGGLLLLPSSWPSPRTRLNAGRSASLRRHRSSVYPRFLRGESLHQVVVAAGP
jgi:hypothetical protein